MNFDLYKKLHEEGLISDISLEKVKERHDHPLFSVHWELKTLLYLGVMLLSSGLGILIYKNIDTIGHQVILLMIALLSASCFFYCFKRKKPFDKEKVKSPDSFFDYILLLGCLSFVSFLGYLQFQYTVFGDHYGLATLIPMLVLFYVAYQFDHQGILGLAITNMAIYMGVAATPKALLTAGTYDDPSLITVYLLLAIILLSVAFLSERYNFKKHFKFNYLHFGVHIGFISLLSGYFFHYDQPSCLLWLLGVFVLAFLLYMDAVKNKSFYFLLLTVLYSYFTISSLVIRGLDSMRDNDNIIFGFLYFTLSSIGLVIFLIRLNKKIKGA